MSWYYRISNRLIPLPQAEMEANVDEIYAQLYSNYTWSVNAICAVLGNIQYESYVNPAQTQSGFPLDSMRGGYGLMQWTPAKKIKNWLQANNHSLYSGYWQVYYLANVYDEEYYPTSEYPETYDEFKHSGQSVDYLTRCFFKNYVRGTWDEERVDMAEDWYRYLMGTEPPQPSPTPPQPIDPPDPVDPDPSGYKGIRKTWLFLRSRHHYPR